MHHLQLSVMQNGTDVLRDAYYYITGLMAHSQSSRDIFNSLIVAFADTQGIGQYHKGLAWFVRRGYGEASSARKGEALS